MYKYPCYQVGILLKDNGIFPSIVKVKDFVSKTTAWGVSLQGDTSKRDNIWLSPALTCINPNLIPVNRTTRSGITGVQDTVE
jgi:hypothetical protein